MPQPELTKDLLLDVWKEVGRHDALGESLERLAPRIAREFALKRLVVRRFEEQAQRLETIATAELARSAEQPPARLALSSDDQLRVLDWARRGAVTAWRAREADPLRSLLEPQGKPQHL